MLKKNTIIPMFAFLLFSFSLFLGCDNQGPAEKAGEKVDDAVESVKDAADEAGDKITGQGPAEEMGEKIDDAVDDLKQSVSSKDASSN